MAHSQLHGGSQAVVRPFSPLGPKCPASGQPTMEVKGQGIPHGPVPQVGKMMDWAERQVDPITVERQPSAAHLIWDHGVAEVSAVVFTAVQETISDQLRMTLPDLAGDAMGLELWCLLVREHEAPEQPLVQREFQKRWAYPRRCTDSHELRARVPQWEV